MFERTSAFSSYYPTTCPTTTAKRQGKRVLSSSSLVRLSAHSNPLLQIASTAAASSILVSSNNDISTTTATATTTFEPVLNVPAMGSFVLIMTLFLLLLLRMGAISEAVDTRVAALQDLRQVKSNELSQQATSADVAAAVLQYTTALVAEESLRTLVPGIQLRAPNNPQRSVLDRQAARQFLGQDDTGLLLGEPAAAGEEDIPSNLPPLALAALWAVIFGSLSLLLLFLTMDDTTANEVLNSLSSSTGGDASSSGSAAAEAIGDLVSLE